MLPVSVPLLITLRFYCQKKANIELVFNFCHFLESKLMLFLLLMFISGEVINSQGDHRTVEELEEYCDDNPWASECQDLVNPITDPPSPPEPPQIDEK